MDIYVEELKKDGLDATIVYVMENLPSKAANIEIDFTKKFHYDFDKRKIKENLKKYFPNNRCDYPIKTCFANKIK